MKQLQNSLSLFACLHFFSAISQINQWAWINGDSTININGVYGTKGISAPANKPGSRCLAVHWTDNSGNLWLFGGWGYSAVGVGPMLSDLWKYDIGTGEWIWVSGDSIASQPGIYGIKGSSSAANKPGSRHWATSCTDKSGNLWLWGGVGNAATGSGLLNDLWKYNIENNQWTWVSGDNIADQSSIYGAKGIPAAGNKPGGRQSTVCWTDNSGNFWLFGGWGYHATGTDYLSDLWKYDIVTSQWTWVSGDNIGSQVSIYGTKGTPDAANKPGSRNDGVSWTGNSGDLWLFGGAGRTAEPGEGLLNDLWKYDIGTNQWTWVSGDNIINQKGVYGTKGISAPANKPGGRYYTMSSIDKLGDLCLFGGWGFDYLLNDLWKYDIGVNQWTWVSGDSIASQNGIYGTKEITDVTNKPGSRMQALLWTDNWGNLWLFGGYGCPAVGGNGDLNDLWVFPFAPAIYLNETNVSCHGSNNGSIAAKTFGTTLPCTYLWSPSGQTTQTVTAISAGTYSVTITDAASVVVAFTTSISQPAALTIVASGNQTICEGTSILLSAYSIEALTFTWVPATGLSSTTGYIITASPLGGSYTYSVIGTNASGCKDTASLALKVFSVSVNAGNDITTCSGLSTLLMARGGDNYTWSPGAGLNNNTIATPAVTLTVPGNYTYTLTAYSAGCKNTDQTKITVLNLPDITIEADQTTICVGNSATLSASGATYYSWSPSIYLSSITGNNITSNPTVRGIYTYTVAGTGSNGCSAVNKISIIVESLPTLHISSDQSICLGSIALISASSSGGNYSWIPTAGLTSIISGNTTFTTSVSGVYNYTLTLTSNVCPASISDDISITVLPLPTISMSDPQTIFSGSSIQLSVLETYLSGLVWSPIESLSCDICSVTTASPSVTTKYYVTITDDNGCRRVDSTLITVKNCGEVIFEFPNTFSPNSDGQNDVLFIKASNTNCIQFINFEIYDRWGVRVFHSNDISVGWEGRSQEKENDPGVFFYQLQVILTDETTINKKGNISLFK